MPIWIYSAESFPDPKNGRTEYIQVMGHQIILEGGKWNKLQSRFERPYWKDFVHRGDGATNRAVSYASKDIHMDYEVADEIISRYGFRGLVKIDENPFDNPKRKAAKETEAKEANKKFREMSIADFENQRKMRQLTGQGRLYPTPYERDCYNVLGLPEPGTIEEIQAEHSPQSVELKFPPEILELVAEGLAARRAAAAPAPAPIPSPEPVS